MALQRGWIIWGAGAALFAFAFFHRVAPGAMFDQLMRDFQAGAAVLGNLAACYFYAYAAIQIPVGRWMDRFGPRRMLLIAAILTAVASGLFAASQSVWLAYAARLAVGAASGIVFVGVLTLAARWLPARRFALATGLTQSVAMLSAVAAQAPLAFVVEAFGWRWAMAAGLPVGLLLGALVWGLTRGEGAAARAMPEAAPPPLGQALRQLLARRQTWVAALYCSAMSVPMICFALLWGVAYLAQAKGLPRADASLGAAGMLFGWALGAPAIGWLSDRLGRRRAPMLAGALVACALWCLFLAVPDMPLPALLAVVFAIGVASSAMPLSFAHARETNPAGIAGLATAFVNFASILAGALAQPLVGWLLDLAWTGASADGARVFEAAAYERAFGLFPLVALLGVVSALCLVETRCRPLADPLAARID